MVDLKQIPVITNRPIGRRDIRDVGGPVLKILYKRMRIRWCKNIALDDTGDYRMSSTSGTDMAGL
jgi:hypothetical protein